MQWISFDKLKIELENSGEKERLKEQLLYAIVGTFIFSMAANAFAYFNFYPQHDSIARTFYFAAGWEVSLGRFLLPLYGMMRGEMIMPWLSGALSILYISGAVFFVCDLLGLRKRWQVLLTAGFLSANITITEMCAVFIYVDDAYMLSFLLSCGGVWCAVKLRGMGSIIASAICFMLSLGLYQAYIVTGVILFVVIICKELGDGKCRERCMAWVKYALCGGIGFGLYFLCYYVSLIVWKEQPASSDSYNSMSRVFSIFDATILQRIKEAYVQFYSFFFGKNELLGKGAVCCNVAIALIAMWAVVIRFREKKISYLLAVILGVGCYPLFALLMSILMQSSKIDFLVSYGIFMGYVFLVMVIGSVNKRWMEKLCIIFSAVIIMANISFSNEVYTVQKIMYDRTLVAMSRVMEDIDTVEGYRMDETGIVLYGTFDGAESVNWIAGRAKVLRGFSKMSVTYSSTFRNFARYLGYDLKIVSDEQFLNKYENEINGMPCFPEEGYCKMLGEHVVIKLGE